MIERISNHIHSTLPLSFWKLVLELKDNCDQVYYNALKKDYSMNNPDEIDKIFHRLEEEINQHQTH